MAANTAPMKAGELAVPGKDAQSVDVSNINLAYDRSSQNDYTVAKVDKHTEFDTAAMVGQELGAGNDAPTPVPQSTNSSLAAVPKNVLTIPNASRGSASAQVSNINLVIDTPSQNDYDRQRTAHDVDVESTATMEGREVGGEPQSPRIPVVKETEVSNINLALDTPSQGDYTAAQVREERGDTDVMVGKEVGGRAISPDPQSVQSPGGNRSAANDTATAQPASSSTGPTPADTTNANNNTNAAAATKTPNSQPAKKASCCVIS